MLGRLLTAAQVLGLWLVGPRLWAQPPGDSLPEPTQEQSFHAALAMLFSMIFGLVVTFVGLRLVYLWRRRREEAGDPQQQSADDPFTRAQRYFEEQEEQ